jgi:hypothetical protein
MAKQKNSTPAQRKNEKKRTASFNNMTAMLKRAEACLIYSKGACLEQSTTFVETGKIVKHQVRAERIEDAVRIVQDILNRR